MMGARQGATKQTKLPSDSFTPQEQSQAQPQFQQPPPILDQAINKVSSAPLAPLAPLTSSFNSAPTENPYLKKEPAKDVRSEAKEASQKRMSKLWEQPNSSTEKKAKTPDLGETFKSMFGGGNAQDAKKQQKEEALKVLLELE